MIDAAQARRTAEAALATLERDTGKQVAIWDGQFGVQAVTEHEDAFVVMWNAVEYLETGDFLKQLLSGPIVVPKDGGEWFLLGTALPVEQQLADWRAARADAG